MSDQPEIRRVTAEEATERLTALVHDPVAWQAMFYLICNHNSFVDILDYQADVELWLETEKRAKDG